MRLILLRNCTKTVFEKSRGEGDSTGYVVLGPQSNPIVSGHLTDLFEDVYDFKVKYLDNEDAMNDYIKESGYGGIDSQGNH